MIERLYYKLNVTNYTLKINKDKNSPFLFDNCYLNRKYEPWNQKVRYKSFIMAKVLTKTTKSKGIHEVSLKI